MGGTSRAQLTLTSGQSRGENELRSGWIKHVSKDVALFYCFLCSEGAASLPLMGNPLCNERENQHTHTHVHTMRTKMVTALFTLTLLCACSTWGKHNALLSPDDHITEALTNLLTLWASMLKSLNISSISRVHRLYTVHVLLLQDIVVTLWRGTQAIKTNRADVVSV